MQKLLSGLAAAAALTLLVSAGYACGFHATHVTASIEEEGVAMSTYDGATQPPIIDELTESAVASECEEGATDCTPAEE